MSSNLLVLLSALAMASGGILGCAPASDRSGPVNIILVSLDTFRADRLGVFGNQHGLTPNLDAFAAQATVFTNAYSQSPTTGPSHASMFTSRYPSQVVGPGARARIPDSMFTLPEVLDKYEYQTAARVAGGDLSPEIFSTRGFDSYVAVAQFGSLWHTMPAAIEWLDSADPSQPFFLFLHGYDTHTTYLKPTPFGLISTGLSELTPDQLDAINSTPNVIDGRLHKSTLLLEEMSYTLRPRSAAGKKRTADRVANMRRTLPVVSAVDQELLRRTYDGAAAYADLQFGLLLARLEARGRLDDTVVVVMSDHGEPLGEDGLFHRCCSLDDAVTHVPLLIRLPKGEGGGNRVEGLVELVDIMPTLLELVGARAPADIEGVSLVPALRGEPFPGRRASMSVGPRMLSARRQSGRLTYSGVPEDSEFLGDIVAAAELPGPSFVATDSLDLPGQSSLRDEMVRWIRSAGPATTDTEGPPIPPELSAILQAEGYWNAQ